MMDGVLLAYLFHLFVCVMYIRLEWNLIFCKGYASKEMYLKLYELNCAM